MQQISSVVYILGITTSLSIVSCSNVTKEPLFLKAQPLSSPTETNHIEANYTETAPVKITQQPITPTHNIQSQTTSKKLKQSNTTLKEPTLNSSSISHNSPTKNTHQKTKKLVEKTAINKQTITLRGEKKRVETDTTKNHLQSIEVQPKLLIVKDTDSVKQLKEARLQDNKQVKAKVNRSSRELSKSESVIAQKSTVTIIKDNPTNKNSPTNKDGPIKLVEKSTVSPSNQLSNQYAEEEKRTSENDIARLESLLVSIEVSSYSTVFLDDDNSHITGLAQADFTSGKLSSISSSSASLSVEASDSQAIKQRNIAVTNSKIAADESLDMINKAENVNLEEDNSSLNNITSSVKINRSTTANKTVSLNKKGALLTVGDSVLDRLADGKDFRGDVFNIVKQANEVISESDKRNIIASLSNNIDQLLSLDWILSVPNKTQYNDSKFSYCLRILDEMRSGSYAVQPPFKINSLDQNDWVQNLDGVTLVQINDVELELYTINEKNVAFNAVATVFNTDKTLSIILPGVSSANDHFFGVFAYSDLNQLSVGGAGRFYSRDKIKNIQPYLIKWNFQYYLLHTEIRANRYKVMEIIPLLAKQQERQRNCRWRH